jgi:hypothetical protein
MHGAAHHLSALKVRSYPDFASLREDSVAAVEVTAGESAERTVIGGDGNALPQTLTTVTVTRTLWGSAPSTFPVVQLGAGGYALDDTGPLLARGSSYLMFVRAAGLPGAYVITGADTFYLKSGNTFALASQSAGAGLPASFSEQDAAVKVRS